MDADQSPMVDPFDQMSWLQMEAKRKALESGAATLLGRILLAFGAFERSMDFCIVWAYGGQKIEVLTKRIDEWSVDKKIELLEKLVHEICAPGGAAHIAYSAWLAKADGIRMIRNQLAHGRWDVDVRTDEVVNYRGIASSPEQRESRFTLHGLGYFVETLESQQTQLHRLRKLFPL